MTGAVTGAGVGTAAGATAAAACVAGTTAEATGAAVGTLAEVTGPVYFSAAFCALVRVPRSLRVSEPRTALSAFFAAGNAVGAFFGVNPKSARTGFPAWKKPVITPLSSA